MRTIVKSFLFYSISFSFLLLSILFFFLFFFLPPLHFLFPSIFFFLFIPGFLIPFPFRSQFGPRCNEISSLFCQVCSNLPKAIQSDTDSSPNLVSLVSSFPPAVRPSKQLPVHPFNHPFIRPQCRHATIRIHLLCFLALFSSFFFMLNFFFFTS